MQKREAGWGSPKSGAGKGERANGYFSRWGMLRMLWRGLLLAWLMTSFAQSPAGVLAQATPVDTQPDAAPAAQIYLPLIATAAGPENGNDGGMPSPSIPTGDHAYDDYFLAAQARARNEAPFVAPEVSAAAPTDWVHIGEWGAVTPWPFVFTAAANLPDGRLLAWGSNNLRNFTGGASTYAAIWDPTTGDFQAVNHPNHSMFCGIPTMLEDGRILVNGGDGTRRRTSTFDYRTEQWQRVEDMNYGRWYPGTVALANGQVFTALGDPGSPYPERWQPGQGWSLLTGASLQAPILSYPGYQKNWLPYLHLAPNGQIFHSGPTPQMNWLDPTGNGAVTPAGPTNLWYPKYSAIVMFDEGKLLMAGGATTNTVGAPGTNQAAVIDLTAPTPTIQPITPMTYARKFNNGVVLPNGEVMIIGGTTFGYEFVDWGTILTPEIWNPTTQRWRLVANIAVPRNYHSVALLMTDGRVWTGGGGLCNCVADHPDAQIYTPGYLFNQDGSPASRPQIMAAPDVVTYGRTVTVTASPDLQKFSLVKMAGVTHDLISDLRYLSVPFTETVSGQYQLTFHRNPHVLTPGYWMLFALNAQGTPSLAKVIQVTSGRPYLPVIDNLGHVVADAITFPIQASDPDGDPLTFVAAGLPPGLAINPTTGVITGVATTTGNYATMVTVSDGVNQVTERFGWLINQPGRYRYVKLVARTEVNGRPWRSAAEINLLDGSGDPIPRRGWQITASGEETQSGDGRAQNAIDGNPNTIWYIQQSAATAPWLQIDLGGDYTLSAIRYLPRQDSVTEGTIADYELFVSPNGVDWGTMASGRFANDRSEKHVLFVGYRPEFNVARGKAVAQSSSQVDGAAAQAIDGNRDGLFANHSVAATQPETNGWWEIDLGQRYNLTAIRLWPRTDCCLAQAGTQHVLISGTPFVTQTLSATQRQLGVSDFLVTAHRDQPLELAVNRTGRYVRIQLEGADALHLAEVEILANLTVPLPEPLALSPPTTTPHPIATAITFQAQASGGARPQFKWLFGDGSPESAYTATLTTTHSFAQPGLYVVTLTASDELGEEQRITFLQMIHRPRTARPPVATTSILYETRPTNNARVWVVNSDNNTVTVFDVVTQQKLAEIDVGQAPRTLALAPNGRVWVANQASATISIIDADQLSVIQTLTLPAATQPFGLAFAPAGDHAYVTLAATGVLLRLDPVTGAPTGSVTVGGVLRHLSINSDGSRLYLPRFITPPLPGEASATPQALVNGVSYGGEIVVVDGATLALNKTIVLQASDQLDTEHTARGIPNYLGPAVIAPDGLTAWVPSKQDNIFRGSLRDGRNLTFESTVRSITSRVDLLVGAEELQARFDHDNGGIAVTALFDHTGNYLFVALEGSREVAVIDAYGQRELFRIAVGRAPQGLALAPDGRHLYVHNFMDRTITVHELTALLIPGADTVATLATYQTVTDERLSPQVLTGKQLFYDAQDPRLARDGYLSCAACHNEGGHDGRVWDLTGFGEGLRNTIDLTGHAGLGEGSLHWSANFDEIQDFEGQIRTLAGGRGLLSDADFAATQDSWGPPKAGRSAALDALAAYVASLTTVAASPYRQKDGALTAAGLAGKSIFQSARCAECHASQHFTDSSLTHLHDIGTLKPTSGRRLGVYLAGIDTPTLRNGWATAPYLHDGSAATLADAVRAHAGVLLTESDLVDLVAYLNQIDGREPAPQLRNRPPRLQLPGIITSMVGQRVAVRADASDPDGNRLTFSATGLPPTLNIDPATGEMAGMTTVAGLYTATVVVSDGLGEGVSVDFVWSVANSANQLPTLVPPRPQTSVIGENVMLPIVAYDPDGNPLTYTATGLPPGLAIDSHTGEIHGIVTTSGLYSATIHVYDGAATVDLLLPWRVTATASYRYVRLAAHSAAQGELWVAAAEIELFDTNGQAINRTAWHLTPDSEERQHELGQVSHAIDGDPNTRWQSQWQAADPATPHWLVIDLGASYRIGGLRYLPQQPNVLTTSPQAAAGVIANYSLFLSNDGVTWGAPVAQGRFTADQSAKFIVLPEMRGALLYEWWADISGSQVDDLVSNARYPYQPSGRLLAPTFEAPSNWVEHAGARLRGFLYPPVTGQYRFWIAGDDTARLFLSTDAAPFNAKPMAAAPGWTFTHEWNRYPEQQSGLITLHANQRYYIEALQKEATGGDNLAVAWQIPGAAPALITGEYLAPMSVPAVTDVALGKTVIHTPPVNEFDDKPATTSQALASHPQSEPTGNLGTRPDLTTDEWWQVDLAANYAIDSMQLWQDTTCCDQGVATLTIFISNHDLTGRTLAELLADVTLARYQIAGESAQKFTIPGGVTGRYVRVQVTGKNNFALGKIEVWGVAR